MLLADAPVMSIFLPTIAGLSLYLGVGSLRSRTAEQQMATFKLEPFVEHRLSSEDRKRKLKKNKQQKNKTERLGRRLYK